MEAKITNPHGYRCCPNGYALETFAHGAIVTGNVAAWAVDSGNAVALETATEPQLERKRGRKSKAAEQ